MQLVPQLVILSHHEIILLICQFANLNMQGGNVRSQLKVMLVLYRNFGMLLGNARENEYRDLANELKLLIHIGEHPHIVNLLGACTRRNNLLVILEYCSEGALFNYLRLKRDDFEEVWTCGGSVNITLYDLTLMAVQVAEGMVFLEKQKVSDLKFSHRCLCICPCLTS